MPVALAYDRVPDATALLNELHGRGKSPMTLFGLGKWLRRAFTGEVELGRMHLAAAPPIPLTPDEDVGEVARLVQAGQRAMMATTTLHLSAFAARAELNAEALRRSLEARGAHVLESDLEVEVSDEEERWMRPHWQHLIAPELQRWSRHTAVEDFLARTTDPEPEPAPGPVQQRVDPVATKAAEVLAKSVNDDWDRALTALNDIPMRRSDVVERATGAWPDEVQAAINWMLRQELLVERDGVLHPGVRYTGPESLGQRKRALEGGSR